MATPFFAAKQEWAETIGNIGKPVNASWPHAEPEKNLVTAARTPKADLRSGRGGDQPILGNLLDAA